MSIAIQWQPAPGGDLSTGHKGIKAARSQYDAWRAIAETTQWKTQTEVKAAHPKASILKNGRVVFNIKANDFRLIALIQYESRRLNDPFLRIARGLRQGECGDRVMKATLIVIESDSEHAQAKALVGGLLGSRKPDDRVRMVAQARLIEAYELSRWPRRAPGLPDLLNYLMDQHGLLRNDLVPLLGTASRVSEVMNGKRELSMTMVRKLRERFQVSADLLISAPPPRRSSVAA
jgi:HTH-type transcriptional regulator / antitoxin HigA